MPILSTTKRSSSLPSDARIVSDASIADLQSYFKTCSLRKKQTFQINTMHFGSPEHCSRTCNSEQLPESSSSAHTSRTDFPSKGSLNCLHHKRPFRICRPKGVTWIRICKKPSKTGSLKEPVRRGLPKYAPRTCVRESLTDRNSKKIGSTKISPNSDPAEDNLSTDFSKHSLNSLGEDSSMTGLAKEPVSITKEFPRSCLSRAQSKCHTKHKKTTFKGDCGKCSESCSSDEAKELYFNAQAKKSAGSTSRVPYINERSSDIEKIEPADSTDSMINIEQDAKFESCDGILKDSGATSSLADSRAPSATCDASATYYQNKLLATLQILQNKEQTIRIQADSLAVAEERIATLTERAHELKRELDRKTKEYTILRQSVDTKSVEKTDVCVVTDRPMEHQRDIVNTLENNLSVIEDLYRECFYETAKQENLIEMLRSSYLEMRLMDKQKADQIGRLQTVINTQQWSLDRCQDIALEVDSLKMEISNFLNSSSSTNNDSGMWERSEESYAAAPGVQDDLHDVRELLLRLQDVLALDSCTCDAENMMWKKKAERLEIKIGELRGRVNELECNLSSKWEEDLKNKAELESKEQELGRIKEQLIRSEDCSRDQRSTVDAVSIQLEQAKALLCEKTTELTQLREENETQAKNIQDLQEQLAKADHIIEENGKMHSEVARLSAQVSAWRAQLARSRARAHALHAQLARAAALAAHADTCYREKAGTVSELQAQLDEAHARGTALCGEARRAVAGVRAWMRRMRDKHRELENLQKEKDCYIAALQRRLEESQNVSQVTRASGNITSCSRCHENRNETNVCSKCRKRWRQCNEPSANEMPSCSSAPTAIRLRKKSGNKAATWICDAAQQLPVRQDAGCDAGSSAGSDDGSCACSGAGSPYSRHHDVQHVCLALERGAMQRSVSPAEQLLQRVEQLSEALADGNRRWTRARNER